MTNVARDEAFIFVLAGVNGAGKSSIGGAFLGANQREYFNPDDAARRIRKMTDAPIDEANALAWQEGKMRLEAAIHTRRTYAFESTLGGDTIPRLLREAAETGLKVMVWFVGLSTPEQHIARVRARVASGGHDIPEEMIRQRWDTSRRNVIALMPFLADLWVFDNSQEGDRSGETIPPPRELLCWSDGAIVSPDAEALATTPEWAKPIVARALQLQRAAK
ncbi:MAG TPA: ZTL protein [Thermoanaerobaculia bacterium]|nr:ZTL protein [Thermoanaerobaculia bacterium]